MSKNIYITEGRKGRRFGSVKKLKTELQGGGSCLWVPEDDVQLEPLFATENGVYTPDEYGFSDASISVVDANIGMLDAGNNWPYFPDGDLDGYGKVNVNVPEERQNTFTDAIQIETLGYRADLPYLTTIFSDYTSVQGNSHGQLSVSIQSKYPSFVAQSTRDKPAVSLYGDGYDNFRMHISWRLTDSDTRDRIVPYCYLDPVTIFVRNLFTTGVNTIGTGLIQSGLSGTGLKYANTPIEDYPHAVDDTTIGQFVIEKYGGYNYACVRGNTFARILTKTSQWSTPSTDSDLSENRVITHIQSRDDPTTFYYSSQIVDLDYRIIRGMSFASGAEWLAWCKTH